MAKKNNVELYKIIPDSKIYDIRLCTDGVTGFTEAIHESDLKDLRSLIDTVLGEEKCHYKEHRHKTADELYSCLCCVRNLKEGDEIIRVDSHPLTEGDGECCKECSKCPDYDYAHKYCHKTDCQCHNPQESNKEGEPSKKQSMTIGCMECGNNIKI